MHCNHIPDFLSPHIHRTAKISRLYRGMSCQAHTALALVQVRGQTTCLSVARQPDTGCQKIYPRLFTMTQVVKQFTLTAQVETHTV